MTSERQRAANRQNSRSSSGPRSAAGKTQASRNALRHGLAATTSRPPAPTGAIERLARAIGRPGDDPHLFEVAVAIAENHFARRAIQQQRIAVIERLRTATAIALAKGDNSLALARARLLEAWLANREIEAAVPKLREKYHVPQPLQTSESGLPDWDDIVPIRLKALLEESDSIENQQRALDLASKHLKERDRDDYAALEEAIPDLVRLDRYERRIWSAQKRAIREFMNIKLMRKLALCRSA